MKFRPRFSIRDLLLLTLVVALISGWCISNGHFKEKLSYKDQQIGELQRDVLGQQKEQRRLLAALNALQTRPAGPSTGTSAQP
jgi:hypothetical protein